MFLNAEEGLLPLLRFCCTDHDAGVRNAWQPV